jgi:hypothetical protein
MTRTAKQVWTQYIKPLVLWLLQGIIGAVLVAFFAYMFLEWASGCGETYTDSKGKVHINECVWRSEVPTK